jgi:hypothetical protein
MIIRGSQVISRTQGEVSLAKIFELELDDESIKKLARAAALEIILANTAVGELVNAVEHLLQFKLELVAYDQKDMLLLHSVQATRAALKKIMVGEPSKPSDVGN